MNPNRLINTLTLCAVLTALLGSTNGLAARTEPIRALYITDYSNFWHDYQEQQASLREGLSRYINLEISYQTS